MSGGIQRFLQPLGLLLIASLFYLAVVASDCSHLHSCKKAPFTWGLVCSSISIVAALCLMPFAYVQVVPLIVHLAAAAFLTLWWGFGAGWATFKDPYPVTGNGYFSSWAAFTGAVWYLYLSSSGVRQRTSELEERIRTSGYTGVFFIFFLSVIYLIAAVSVFTSHSGESAWAVAFGVIALVFSLVIIVLQLFIQLVIPAQIHVAVAGLLLLFSAAGCGVGTFVGPFKETGNGYFSAWGLLFASLRYFYEALKHARGRTSGDGSADESASTGKAVEGYGSVEEAASV